MSSPADYFDAMFKATSDPWGFRNRWYEKRKRQLTLATLPREHYRRIFEAGCANGELSADLAQRCSELICCDVSPTAAELAKERLTDAAHAHVYAGALPGDWPEGSFDLIVLSEIGYYLDEAALLSVIEQSLESLTPDGALLACHWLHPIEDGPLNGRLVHSLLQQHLTLCKVVCHRENDFLLELWCHHSSALNLREDAL